MNKAEHLSEVGRWVQYATEDLNAVLAETKNIYDIGSTITERS